MENDYNNNNLIIIIIILLYNLNCLLNVSATSLHFEKLSSRHEAEQQSGGARPAGYRDLNNQKITTLCEELKSSKIGNSWCVHRYLPNKYMQISVLYTGELVSLQGLFRGQSLQ